MALWFSTEAKNDRIFLVREKTFFSQDNGIIYFAILKKKKRKGWESIIHNNLSRGNIIVDRNIHTLPCVCVHLNEFLLRLVRLFSH